MSRPKLTAVALVASFALAAPALAAKHGKDGVKIPGRLTQIALSIINPGPTNFRGGVQHTPGFRTASPAAASENAPAPARRLSLGGVLAKIRRQ